MTPPCQPWGRRPKARHTPRYLFWRDQVGPVLAGYGRENALTLPFGFGRSYGDSCISAGHDVLVMRNLNRFISFNPETGLLRCEAGVLLGEILDLVVPRGWFLPVTPGTKYVTVAGAVANDVHGKNHHCEGTFGRHVTQFELVRSDGAKMICSTTGNREMYEAAIGGLGLTGIITWAELRLKRIKSQAIRLETVKYETLRDFFAIMADSDKDYEYTVAWVDSLAAGRQLGRGLVMRGNHAREDTAGRVRKSGKSISVPFTPPFSLINKATAKIFNTLYYSRQIAASRKTLVHYEPFFYPLDSVLQWNRIYGPKGFQQYQCAVPVGQAEAAVREILKKIAASGIVSFLGVLKMFGSVQSPGLMSFPLPGATLALDFPHQGAKTMQLFAELDKTVRQAKGRVYPAKDAHMHPDDFKQFYPQWEQLEALRDPALCSAFWSRVTGVHRQ